MANNSTRGTWYVSFDLPRGQRAHARATETFTNEREAKKFARANLVDTLKSAWARSILIYRNGPSPPRRCLNGSKNRMKAICLEPVGCVNPHGRRLVTLEDAGNYTKLPKAEHDAPKMGRYQSASQSRKCRRRRTCGQLVTPHAK
jgi:hypothetical protein